MKLGLEALPCWFEGLMRSWVVEREKRLEEKGIVMPLQMAVLWRLLSSVSVLLSLFPFGDFGRMTITSRCLVECVREWKLCYAMLCSV